MTPVAGHFESDLNRPQFFRLVDAHNHNLRSIELAAQENPKSLGFLTREYIKSRSWLERRNTAIRELVL